MSLLFKKSSTKVRKFDAGGAIPVYASFTPSFAKPHLYDPSELLKRYAPKERSKEAPKDDKFSGELKPLVGDALISDREETADTYVQMVDRYDSLAREGRADSAEASDLRAKLDYLRSTKLLEEKNRFEAFNKNTALLEKQTGTNEYYTDGSGKMLARSVKGFEYIDPSAVYNTDEEGKKMYAPLTNAAVANLVNTQKGFMELIQNPGDVSIGKDHKTHIIENLGNGMSWDHFRDNILDNHFNGIGETSGEESGSRNGLNELGMLIKENSSSQATTDNAVQLQEAMRYVYETMTPEAKNFLRAKAYTNGTRLESMVGPDGKTIKFDLTQPPTEAEINQKINLNLQAELAKRLKISTKVDNRLLFDYTATADGSGGGGITGATQLSAEFAEQLGVGKAEQVTYEKVSSGDKSTLVTIVAHNAKKSTANIKDKALEEDKTSNGYPLLSKSKLNEYAEVKDATFMNGGKVSDVISDFSSGVFGEAQVTGASGFLQDTETPMKITWVPTYNQDVTYTNPKTKEKVILHKAGSTFTLSSGCVAELEKLDASIPDGQKFNQEHFDKYMEIVNRYAGKQSEQINLKAAYITKVIYNKSAVEAGLNNNTNISGFDKKMLTRDLISNRVESVNPKAIDYYNSDNLYGELTTNGMDDYDDQYDFASTYIIVPIGSPAEAQMSGYNIYIPKENVSIKKMIEGNVDRNKDVTKQQVIDANKTKK